MPQLGFLVTTTIKKIGLVYTRNSCAMLVQVDGS